MLTKPLALLIAGCALLGAAPGKLIVAGKTYALPYVYARLSPDTFDAKKMKTVVVAADRALAPEVRTDPDAVRTMVWDGKLNAVEIEIGDGGIHWSIKAAEVAMSMSGSQSPDPYNLAVAGGRVKGMVKMAAPEKMGDSEYYFEFPVDAVIEKKVEAPAPTAADKVAAQSAASTKAYQAYLVVLMKGDKAGLMKAVDPDKADKINTPEFPEMIKFIQSMQPKNIQVLRAAEKGSTAELAVSGNGGADVGTVQMKQINGAWVVMKESWKKKN